MAHIEMTSEEFFDTLNGFDEIAIRKAFGATVEQLSGSDRLQFARALVFVAKRREGATDKEAHDAAQALTMGELGDYFTDDEEVTPDEPTTEPGKDDRPPF